MIPVEIACMASVSNFKQFLPDLIPKFFKATEERFSWSFVYKCRNNNKFMKSEFFEVIGPLIPPNYYHLSYNGDMIIMVDVTQHLMCVSVFNNFEKYKKYSFACCLKSEGKGQNEEEEQEMDREKEEQETKNNEGAKLEIHNVENNENEDISLF